MSTTRLLKADIDDIDFSVDDMTDLPARVARMRAVEPATWVRFAGEPALHLNTYDLVKAGFRDEVNIPGHGFYEETQQPAMGWTVQSLSGKAHHTARGLQSPFFRRSLLPSYIASLFEPVAHELIDKFIDDGEADLVAEFTKQYPPRVIMRLLDLEVSADVNWSQLAWEMIQYGHNPDVAEAAIAEFDRRIGPILEERRRHPGNDLISALLAAEVDGERMSDDEVFSFVRLMFPAGSDTTLLGLGNTLLALLTHPEAMDRTVADPEHEIPWAVEEGLRWQPSVAHLPRRSVSDDIEWNGIPIPGGTMVLLSVLSANRDPAQFSDPDRFDLERHSQRTLTFGLATHHCLGEHFARAEMSIALRTLLDRLPNLRLSAPEQAPLVHGSVLRGPDRLPVTFG
ncbi:cytochrome P450 [Amycolatopsis sp. GM8]|uniref:cytochrome P450 n=1 Tax=Amycolatopsis sp. GM8 TaxID=2896530 RepID=UPI001F466F5D|nr:cytochrome P450 [Amycolatopsis sp. GM8]